MSGCIAAIVGHEIRGRKRCHHSWVDRLWAMAVFSRKGWILQLSHTSIAHAHRLNNNATKLNTHRSRQPPSRPRQDHGRGYDHPASP
jgi:hypothetical protein